MTKSDEIIKAILAEVYRAETIHPHWPKDLIHASAIVCEESGELIRESLNITFGKGDMNDLKKEAIQTAATCIRLLKNL